MPSSTDEPATAGTRDPSHICDDAGDRHCQEWEDETEWDDMEPDECEHEYSDIDILTGRMLCLSCGYTHWLTGDELQREAELQAEIAEAYDRECEQTEQDAKAAT